MINVAKVVQQAHAIRSALRQFLQPREFRIDLHPLSPETLAKVNELVTRLSVPTATLTTLPLPKGSPEALAILTAVGVGLWRIRQKLVDPTTGQPIDATRRAFRHLDTLWSTLSEAGLEIRGHTGEVLPRGGSLSLKIIAFQPTPGTSRDYVLETIKPSVLYKGSLVQMAEVIVAAPILAERQAADHSAQ